MTISNQGGSYQAILKCAFGEWREHRVVFQWETRYRPDRYTFLFQALIEGQEEAIPLVTVDSSNPRAREAWDEAVREGHPAILREARAFLQAAKGFLAECTVTDATGILFEGLLSLEDALEHLQNLEAFDPEPPEEDNDHREGKILAFRRAPERPGDPAGPGDDSADPPEEEDAAPPSPEWKVLLKNEVLKSFEAALAKMEDLLILPERYVVTRPSRLAGRTVLVFYVRRPHESERFGTVPAEEYHGGRGVILRVDGRHFLVDGAALRGVLANLRGEMRSAGIDPDLQPPFPLLQVERVDGLTRLAPVAWSDLIRPGGDWDRTGPKGAAP